MKFLIRHYSKLVPAEPAIFAASFLLVTSFTYHTIDDRLILERFQSVFGSSICEMSVDSEAQFGENLSESSSEGCSESSEASFNSASEDF